MPPPGNSGIERLKDTAQWMALPGGVMTPPYIWKGRYHEANQQR